MAKLVRRSVLLTCAAIVVGLCGGCDPASFHDEPEFAGFSGAQFQTPTCKAPPDGAVGSNTAFVGSPETARRIASAMIMEVSGERGKYKTFSIEQVERVWKVTSHDQEGVFGGGLVFDIDKCTGEVRRAEFSE